MKNSLSFISKSVITALLVMTAAVTSWASASNVYITQSGSPSGACTTGVQTPAFFNNSANWGSGTAQIGPGTTVHLCGAFTFPAGTTGLTFQGSGSSGSPIMLLFESGAVVQAPYFATSAGGVAAGGITLGNGRSWLTVDGNGVGIVQNTANGSNFANQQASTGVSGFGCTNCTVKNLTIANIYVNATGNGGFGDNNVLRAIDFNGKNWTVTGNTIHDCGWCIFDAYADGDTNANIYNNDVSDFGHGVMYAAGSPVSAVSPALKMHDNHFHDTANWGASGCPFHQDGLHMFGVTGSSIDGVYVYNNLFDGDWGTCPTGFIFVEAGGSGSPANVKNSYWWNNVMLIQTGIVNTNGWFNLSSGISGVQKVWNNTIVNVNATDNTACYVMGNLSGLTFENNVASPCGDPVRIDSSTINLLSNNFYGPSCQNGNNCFVFNGAFTGSFANWKTATHGDTNSVQSNAPLLNTDGSPKTGSPAISTGANLSSTATGLFASLALDTSKGNTRIPLSRATTGPWDPGAYVSGGGSPTSTAPPTFSPTSENFTGSESVTLSDTTAGAVIRYTVDGTTPSATNGTVYSSPISLVATATVKAIASASGLADSAVVSNTYTLNTTTPPSGITPIQFLDNGVIQAAPSGTVSKTITVSKGDLLLTTNAAYGDTTTNPVLHAPTDSGLNTWTLVDTKSSATGVAGNVTAAWYWAIAKAAGPITVTFTATGGSTIIATTIMLAEYSGVASVALDKHGVSLVGSASSPANSVTTPLVSPGASGELLVSWGLDLGSASDASWTSSTGWLSRLVVGDANTLSETITDQFPAGTSSYSNTLTPVHQGSVGLLGFVGTFFPAGAAPPAPPTNLTAVIN